jgi:integrase
MADHFDESIAGFSDALPYSGRRKCAGTVEQYTDSAERLVAWARARPPELCHAHQDGQALRRYLRWRAETHYADSEASWIGQRCPMAVSGLGRLIRIVGARARVDGMHPHLLRHTWAHYYRLDGGQVDNLTYLAGWSGPAMAMRYGRSAAAERAREEAKGLSVLDRRRGRRTA